MSNYEAKLETARKLANRGEKHKAASMINEIASSLANEGNYQEAAKYYEEAAMLYRDSYRADECFEALENATLMFVRLGSNPENNRQIVRINKMAAEIANIATEYKTAANFLFRAVDFASSEEEKTALQIKAIDALEKLADLREEEGDFDEAISLLKKVGRLYFTIGDDELGERIYERAIKLAFRWSQRAKEEGDLLSAGNALAEAAQIMQTKGEAPEAPRIMMEAGELYTQAGLYEKAGNIYDAAQEAYKLERNTSARRKAMVLAAESYLKMEGKPEVIAPLLMKAGALFKELSNVKSKWAYKRASELFEQLANKSAKEGDIESEKMYLRYMAMSLKEWGRTDEANQVYQEVIDYFLSQAEKEKREGNKELHALSLEEVYDVLLEAGREEEAKRYLEQAVDIYVELAEEMIEAQQFDEASKYYSKAASCAERLGDMSRTPELYQQASDYAIKAAEFYKEIGVDELSVLWTRTAAQEALKTERLEMIDRAIRLLGESAKKFEEMNEVNDSFGDLFTLFETLFLYYPDREDEIHSILKSLDRVAMMTRDDANIVLASIAHHLNKGNHIGALMLYQENEEDLLDKHDQIRALIAQSKRVRAEKW